MSEDNNDHMDTRCWGFKADDSPAGFESRLFATYDEREAAGYVDHPSKIRKAEKPALKTVPPPPAPKKGKDDDDVKH